MFASRTMNSVAGCASLAGIALFEIAPVKFEPVDPGRPPWRQVCPGVGVLGLNDHTIEDLSAVSAWCVTALTADEARSR